jgi:hypothetical protein
MPRRGIPRPLSGARNAAHRIWEILGEVRALRAELEQTDLHVRELNTLINHVGGHTLTAIDKNRLELAHIVEILELLRDDEPATRRLLWQVRDTPEYAAAYEEAEPLVSVLIPTYTNTKGLIEVALPSVVAQTYERLEVVVVGDAANPDVEEAVRRFGDKRIRYANLTHRGPYPDDPEKLWLVAGGPPMNEAMRLARGAWLAQMDDDDVAAPNRIELLLGAARERQLEFCYGRIRQHHPDGTEKLLCHFPPNSHDVGLAASLMHAGIKFIQSELGDYLFGIVGDWARIRRMMRIGVRIGMIDEVVLDYYPGLLWKAEAERSDVGGR